MAKRPEATLRLPADAGPVEVYRNLQAVPPAWSVRSKATSRVLGVSSDVLLAGAEAKVQAGGVRLVRERRRKRVVAWVTGELREGWRPGSDAAAAELGFVEATFNPYLFDSFVLAHNYAPVERAALAWFAPSMRLWLRLYPGDLALVRRRVAPPSAERVALFEEARRTARGQRGVRENPGRGPSTLYWNG